MEKKKINERIIGLMADNAVDEAEMAAAIGKDKSTIYRITAQTVVPTKTTVKLIADKFGWDYEFLMTGKTRRFATKDDPGVTTKEALELLREDLRYIKAKYDQLFDAFLKGNMGKLKAFRVAGSRNKDLLKVGK